MDRENWIVRVSAPAVDGKANTAVIKSVAKELGIAPSLIQLKTGATSRKKILEIPDDHLQMDPGKK